MARSLPRSFVLVVLVLASALAGLYASARLAPERLRTEIEQRLTREIGSPVAIGGLRLVLGFPIHLEGRDVRLWPSPEGAGLRVERVTARVSVVALLGGGFRLNRLVLEGAHLRIHRSPKGEDAVWWPEPFEELATPKPDRGTDEPALAAVRVIEGITRFLLERPLLARTCEVRRSTVSFEDRVVSDAGPVRRAFEGVTGMLRHSQVRGDADLFLRTWIVAEGQDGGGLEWEGRREYDGALSFAMAGTSLDLGLLVPYVRQLDPGARLEGLLSGFAEYETSEPGVGRLATDLMIRDLESVVPVGGETGLQPLEAALLEARMDVHVDAEQVMVSAARVTSGPVDLRLEAVLERPLRASSQADVSTEFRDVDLGELHRLLGWMPPVERERVRTVVEALESGQLRVLQLQGSASLDEWRSLLAGQSDRLPKGFFAETQVADLTLRVGEEDRIEGVEAGILWRNDRVEVHDAKGLLNGSPLPGIDVTLSGVSHLFGAAPAERVLRSGAEPLFGLTPLFDSLGSDSESDGLGPVEIEVAVDFLHYPALLWPIRDLDAVFSTTESGVEVAVRDARWAGVPIRGKVDWTLTPFQRLDVRLKAGPAKRDDSDAASPDESASVPALVAEEGAWAAGRFQVAAVEQGAWQHERMQGRFRAIGADFHLVDVGIELNPSGVGNASARLELQRRDAVPFELAFVLHGADVESLLAQHGFSDVAQGRVDLRGDLAGVLQPERLLFADLEGTVGIEATAGQLQRILPPIVAVALASESYNPFARRESVRFKRCALRVAFQNGHARTDAFELDGPDLRVFASGDVDLVNAPHALRAEVALFLFRQIDRALDKIPFLNILLLGEDQNLLAAYYEVVGPWAEPEARPKPLRTLESGAGDVLIRGIPNVVKRGVKALGGIFGTSDDGASLPQSAPSIPPASGS